LTRELIIGNAAVGGGGPLTLIAGPCVIENEEITFHTAERLKEICGELGFSFRILADVKSRFQVPVLSDIHAADEAKPASEVLDVLQIPAFLCRQTDLILAASNTGKAVNIKKGQFLAPWDMKNTIDKFVSTGNRNIFLTERGTSFGYNNLVVDIRSFPVMRSFGYPVVFDVTHSLQLPGGQGSCSGGQREFAEPLARAAAAAGIDGLFMEVHPDPGKALCDGPNMISLGDLPGILKMVKRIHEVVSAKERLK